MRVQLIEEESMAGAAEACTRIFRSVFHSAGLTLVIVFVLTAIATEAQTFTVLHTFTGGQDGGIPQAGLTLDRQGNLYGTTQGGGGHSYGAVFKLTHKNSAWVFSPLYGFTAGNDGHFPFYGVVFGPNGTLYGATAQGGDDNFGTVFNLKPPATSCKSILCPWLETVLYSFTGGSDGASPEAGSNLIFDQAGNIYGTTYLGGVHYGTVYQLAKSGNSWTQSVLHTFAASGDGKFPLHNVVFDSDGNLYGTTESGGASSADSGTVYQLVPSGSGWTENILVNFTTSGAAGSQPTAGLIVDQSGNLYGATSTGGPGGGGTVFELSPSGGGWTFNVLYKLSGHDCNPYNGGPYGNLLMDKSGALYGTTVCGGANSAGSVFKLTLSGGVWTYTSLHDFNGLSDGAKPFGDLVMDANGNLYGTASAGAGGFGTVWEITP